MVRVTAGLGTSDGTHQPSTAVNLLVSSNKHCFAAEVRGIHYYRVLRSLHIDGQCSMADENSLDMGDAEKKKS